MGSSSSRIHSRRRRCATGLSRSRRPSSASSPAKCAEWSSCSASRSADRPPWRRRQVVVLLVRASLWLMWAGESGDRALLPRVRRRAWTGPADATGGAAVHQRPVRRPRRVHGPGRAARSRGRAGGSHPVPRVRLPGDRVVRRSEEHTSELQSHHDLVCRLLLEKKKKQAKISKLYKQTTQKKTLKN